MIATPEQATTAHAWRVNPRPPAVLQVECDGIGVGWEQRFLVAADIHYDNPHCRRDLLKAQFDEAVERGAGIVIVGDWFDAMQGRDDPRRSKALLSPALAHDYIDAMIDESAAFLRPYAASIVMVSDGNHETAVTRKLETNLTRRLAQSLGAPYMPYSGWIQFRFNSGDGDTKRARTAINAFYHHGSGGGGAVTRGVIQTNRRAAMLANAHICLSGHIHESWSVWIPQAGVTGAGTPYTYDQLHVSTGTYKDEWSEYGGYHIEKGRPPKPLGGMWLRFWYDLKARGRVRYDAMRA